MEAVAKRASRRGGRARHAREQDRNKRREPAPPQVRLGELYWFFRLPGRLGFEAWRTDVRAAIDALGDLTMLSPEEVGSRARMTFDEYKELGNQVRRGRKKHPRTIRPYDATRAEVDAYLLGLKRERDQQAKKASRAARAAALARNGDLDVRAEALFAALDDKWRTISSLARDVSDGETWQGLSGASLRRALNRAAVELARKMSDRIEQKIEPGAKRQPVRSIRLFPVSRRPFVSETPRHRDRKASAH
jgi:hypothetical protein